MCVFINNYFSKKKIINTDEKKLNLLNLKKKTSIARRKNRLSNTNIIGGGTNFAVGDIISFSFSVKNVTEQFEGILIGKRKNLSNLDSTLIVRNVLSGVGIEYTISYYYKRIFYLTCMDYKRKRFIYKRSKIYYIRDKENQASRIK